MKKIALGVIAILALIFVVGGCNGYNKMVTLDQDVKQQWGQVQNVYQRRSDLIPNLVNTVKGYANFEKETLTQVIEARSKATAVNIDASKLTPETFQKFQQAQDGLSSALSRLMVVVEKYPDLKANQNFLELQAQLEGTENRIAVERNKFNEVTGNYNKKVKTFPNNLLAGMFGFSEKPYFQAQPGSEKAPTVQF
ncbi:LemA family protein [Solitalea lacus]|uniref:LemA family protein n=1 Tax=Solitalea lacus TaxID=2911172 RepID=UPI001EDA1716|nr:LemA family protein [Solitalea lacus]UKJ08431.1 LemA family protein [Solitalea lacus]